MGEPSRLPGAPCQRRAWPRHFAGAVADAAEKGAVRLTGPNDLKEEPMLPQSERCRWKSDTHSTDPNGRLFRSRPEARPLSPLRSPRPSVAAPAASMPAQLAVPAVPVTSAAAAAAAASTTSRLVLSPPPRVLVRLCA